MTNSATNPAQKTVAQWASNMRVTEYEFLSVVAYAMEQFNEGNTTEISKLLTIVSGKTSKIIKVNSGDRTSFAGPLMRVLYAAGMTNKKDTGLPMSFKWDAKKASGVTYTKSDNANFSLEVIKSLRVLGKTRVSDKAFKETFPAIPTIKKPAKDWDGQAWAERAIKANGADRLEAMIAALQAKRNLVKKAA